MAPLPVIGNVVRCDLQWGASAGVAPHNTFHIVTNSDDLEEIGLAIGQAFEDASGNCWSALHTSFTAITIDLTPLDGTTARQNVNLGTTLQGDGSGGMTPAVATVLSLRTHQRGPRGRGRLYLGPMSESDFDNGLVGSGVRSTTSSSWPDFNDNLAASSINGSLVVASYIHAEAGAVTSFSVRPQCGTMRRRQDQLVS